MADPDELDYGEECVIELANGGSIRCPVFPEDCSYVRVCDENGHEIAYWTYEEWAEDPEFVMGAILGTAMEPVKLPPLHDRRCRNVHPIYGRCERADLPHARHMTMSYKSGGLHIQPTQWYDEDGRMN